MRRPGKSQSCFLGDKIRHAKTVSFRFESEVRAELVRNHFELFDLFFHLFEDEITIIFALYRV